VAALLFCWRAFLPSFTPRGRVYLLLLFSVLSAFLTWGHYLEVDSGQYFEEMTNTEWQQMINDAAVRRDARFLPHSYRFLPDSFTQWIETLTGSFLYARTLYRWTFCLLLLFAIHRFALLFTSNVASFASVLLYALVYRMTLTDYAGQLVDPASHLSFVAAFLALEIGVFPYFVLAVAVGTLAKETVLALLPSWATTCCFTDHAGGRPGSRSPARRCSVWVSPCSRASPWPGETSATPTSAASVSSTSRGTSRPTGTGDPESCPRSGSSCRSSSPRGRGRRELSGAWSSFSRRCSSSRAWPSAGCTRRGTTCR
jgi:hypothetical protein